MARNINAGSTRQQALVVLGGLTGMPRKEQTKVLMDKFNIGQAYANTLYQKHRNDMKDSGEFVSVYEVKDTKNGNETAPYIKTYKMPPVGLPEGTFDKKDLAVDYYVNKHSMKVQQGKELNINWALLVGLSGSHEEPSPKTSTVASTADNGKWYLRDYNTKKVINSFKTRAQARTAKVAGTYVSKRSD